VAAGAADTQITVYGTGFTSSSVVQWNGAPLETYTLLLPNGTLRDSAGSRPDHARRSLGNREHAHRFSVDLQCGYGEYHQSAGSER